MIRRTLLVVDGTGAASRARAHAAAPARSFEGDLVLLPAGDGAAALEAGCLCEGLRAEGLRCGLLPSARHASEAVLAAIDECGAELVVLPAPDATRDGLRRARVSQEVVARARVSVLVAPPAHTARYARIVAPVDGSRRAEWALCLAISLARTDGAELVLVRAVLDGDAPDRLAAEAYLAEIGALLAIGDPRLRTRIVAGATVPGALAAAFREEAPDLITITAHGALPANGRRYGRIAGALLARAPAAILAFQDAPPRAAPTTAGATR